MTFQLNLDVFKKCQNSRDFVPTISTSYKEGKIKTRCCQNWWEKFPKNGGKRCQIKRVTHQKRRPGQYQWYPYQNHLQNVLEDQIAHKSKKLLVSLSLQVWFAILTQFTKYTDCLFYDAYQFEKAKRSNQIIELLSLGDMALHLRRVFCRLC